MRRPILAGIRTIWKDSMAQTPKDLGMALKALETAGRYFGMWKQVFQGPDSKPLPQAVGGDLYQTIIQMQDKWPNKPCP